MSEGAEKKRACRRVAGEEIQSGEEGTSTHRGGGVGNRCYRGTKTNDGHSHLQVYY